MNQTMNLSSKKVTPLMTSRNTNQNSNNLVLRESETLFRMGDLVDGVYQVNSGAIKLYTITESGDEHIVRFCMPGDILGLEALADGMSKSNAVVLDITNITFIPMNTILSGKGLNLSDFMGKVAETLEKETEHSMMLSQCTAGRRIAWFLVEFAENLSKRGMMPSEFLLPMIRADIALYLGLAIETVSRELTQFSKKGLIKKRLRHFEIIDFDALKAISMDSQAFH